MVYVVERYLPGLSRTNLLSGLSKLESAVEELQGEGLAVRYLGSTIVLGDEACFCQFEGSSETTVAEANRRAGLPFDRIVPAVLVDPTHRRGDMSVSTSVPKTARAGQSHRVLIVLVLAAMIALAAWAITTYAIGSGSRPTSDAAATQRSALFVLTPSERKPVVGIGSMTAAQLQAATQASVLATLTPSERQYVLGIGAMTAAQLRAAFGTVQPAGQRSATDSLTSQERRYVQGITSMSRPQQAAAFGTGK